MAKQSLFVCPVLPEQSPALTMSFMWLSPCRTSSSVLSPMPGSFQQCLPAALPLHSQGTAPRTPVHPLHGAVVISDKAKCFPGKAQAQLRTRKRCLSSESIYSAEMLEVMHHKWGKQPGKWLWSACHRIGLKPQPPIGSGEITRICRATLRLQAVWDRLLELIHCCGL